MHFRPLNSSPMLSTHMSTHSDTYRSKWILLLWFGGFVDNSQTGVFFYRRREKTSSLVKWNVRTWRASSKSTEKRSHFPFSLSLVHRLSPPCTGQLQMIRERRCVHVLDFVTVHCSIVKSVLIGVSLSEPYTNELTFVAVTRDKGIDRPLSLSRAYSLAAFSMGRPRCKLHTEPRKPMHKALAKGRVPPAKYMTSGRIGFLDDMVMISRSASLAMDSTSSQVKAQLINIREVRGVRCPGSDRTAVSPVRTEPDGPQKRLGES